MSQDQLILDPHVVIAIMCLCGAFFAAMILWGLINADKNKGDKTWRGR